MVGARRLCRSSCDRDHPATAGRQGAALQRTEVPVTRAVSGSTSLACVIGDPVRHSLSPALHNAAFAALDLDWIYLAFEVRSGQALEAIAGMRALGVRGASVTMPHKHDAVNACDEVTSRAAVLRSVNCIT